MNRKFLCPKKILVIHIMIIELKKRGEIIVNIVQ